MTYSILSDNCPTESIYLLYRFLLKNKKKKIKNKKKKKKEKEKKKKKKYKR